MKETQSFHLDRNGNCVFRVIRRDLLSVAIAEGQGVDFGIIFPTRASAGMLFFVNPLNIFQL
jgi:hypothetical protein